MDKIHHFDIWYGGYIPSSERPLLIYSKQDNQEIDDDTKKDCQILKFSSEWTPNEIYSKIGRLDSIIYQNLFIFVIEPQIIIDDTKRKKVRVDIEILKSCINKFSRARSMFLLITSKNDNESKFFYKEEFSEEFLVMNCQQFVEAVDDQLLSLMMEKEEKTEDLKILENVCDNILKIPLNLDKNLKIVTSIDIKDDELEQNKSEILDNPTSSSVASKEASSTQKSEEMSQKQILDDVKDQKFVLIINKPSFERSWVLKNLTNCLRDVHPEKWINYVDLKHFIREFKAQDTEIDFLNFLPENILKPKTKFEVEVFTKFYKNGKVCILFDGFDEIDQDCCEFGIKLIQSCQQNGGNQLWIAAKDNFDLNLKEKLELNAVYKLEVPTDKKYSFLTESCQYLLESKVRSNKSLEFHEELWKIIKKYFNSKDIFQMIHYSSTNGYSHFFTTIKDNTKEIIEFTTHEIIAIFVDILRNYKKSDNIQKIIKTWLSKNCSLNVLHIAAKCEKINFHENLWTILENIFEDREELKDLVLQRDQDDNNYVHCLVMSNNSKLIKFGFYKIKRNFNNDQHVEIIMSKGSGERNLLHQVTNASRDIQIQQILWKNFKIFSEKNEKFLEILKEVDSDNNNIFHIAAALPTSETFKFIINETEKIASREEIRKLLSTIGVSGKKLLQIAIKPNKPLEYDHNFWTTIKKFFNNQEISDMMKHNDESGNNLLSKSVGFYGRENTEQTLNDAVNYFFEDMTDGQKKLKDFLMKKDEKGNNFLHSLVIRGKVNKIEFILNKIKEHCDSQDTNDEDYQEIWLSKGESDRNLLQIAVARSEGISTLITLWTFYRRILKSDEQFLTFLKDTDSRGSNVFHLAASVSMKSECFEFLVQGVGMIATFEEVRNILSTLDFSNQNLPQIAAENSKNLRCHENLWKIIQNYFNSTEILDMIKHIDSFGNNIFGIAVQRSTDVIVRYLLDTTNIIVGTSNLMECLINENNIVHILIKEKSEIRLKYIWNNLKYFFASQNLNQQFKGLIIQKASNLHANALQLAVICEGIEFHVALWSFLLETFNDQSEMKDLILQTDKYGNNLLHNLIIYSKPNIIEFTIKKIREILTKIEFQRILSSNGQHGRNLLQKAACSSKDIRTHQILWKYFQHYFQPNEMFLEFVKSIDNHQNNIFHLAVCFSNHEIFIFMIYELEKIMSTDGITRMLSTPGFKNRNLLQSAAIQNKSIEFHQILWQIIQKYFEPTEIMDMINHTSSCGNNVLFYAVGFNTREVAEFTFTRIMKFMNKDYFYNEFLLIKGFKGRDLLQTSLTNKSNPKVHKFCELLFKVRESNISNDNQNNSRKRKLSTDSELPETAIKRQNTEIDEL